jgi:hypothetical protein
VDEIWLNEAFATWMASKASDHFNPTWQMRLNGRRRVDETMAGDATDATRAIRAGPVRETAVFDVFDSITYVKGGAVLDMIEQWLGEEAFRRGLAAYMRERRLSNATAGDLWFHVGRAAGRDVAAMAASWTDQPGFPLVTVSTTCEGGRTRVTLAQQRFRYDTAAASAASSAATPAPRWQIPVRLVRERPRRRYCSPTCRRPPRCRAAAASRCVPTPAGAVLPRRVPAGCAPRRCTIVRLVAGSRPRGAAGRHARTRAVRRPAARRRLALAGVTAAGARRRPRAALQAGDRGV